MDMFLSLARQSLVSAPVLFFALGFLATLAGSHLALPGGASKILALYLMLAIGFKGGVSVAASGLTSEVASMIVLGIVLSAAMPFLGTWLLGLVTRLPPRDRAAIAAHYGSISIVTFAAASDALRAIGVPFDEAMVAVAAAMEAPAIVSELYLIFRRDPAAPAAATPASLEPGHSGALKEVVLNVTIVVLIGAFAIGAILGKRGLDDVAGFIVDPFRGVLCLFLLDLGAVAAAGMKRGWRQLTPALLGFAIVMPLIGAGIAWVAASLLGLSHGNAALMITLAASASYIAVPAAMRIAVPEARPELSLGLSLGLTFPFNIVAGLPVYIWLAGTLG